ncbi:MAG: GspH/FimT family pseudopilin [Chromatiales bacterium]|nr:GspH/FimT family pseudopilin [Chromatiales bacterium]
MERYDYGFRYGNGGFTLLELLVGLAAGVLVLTLAVPAMLDFYRHNLRASSVNRLVSSLHLARSEAVNRTQKITLCPSSDGVQCDSSLEWQDGWMIFANTDSETGTRTDGEPIIRVQSPVGDGIRLVNGSNRRYLVYQPSGTATGFSSKFLACDPDGDADPVGIWLSNTGRIAKVESFSAEDAAACTPQDG